MSSNPIPLEALQLLDAIDRRGSFAKAADELNKAPSALSYGVTKLEDQLGLSIFVRQGRRSVLTPAGRVVLEEGRAILGAAARLAERAKEVATGWETRLRVGVEAIVNQRVFFEILSAFALEHPNLELEVSETVLNGGWEALAQRRIDLVVGSPGPVPAHQGFRARSMGPSDLVPVIAARHLAVAGIDQQRLKDLDWSSLCTVVVRDSSTSDVLASAGLSLSSPRAFSVQTIDQKVEAILAGAGVGHLPRYRIADPLARGALLELPLEPANPDCLIAWEAANRGKALNALVKLLQAGRWGEQVGR
jgi:DNA-binding transcriptional LysR family regulator